jgi:hypothetical protein
MNVEISEVPISDKAVLRNLTELYQYDFSEIRRRPRREHRRHSLLAIDCGGRGRPRRVGRGRGPAAVEIHRDGQVSTMATYDDVAA